MAKETVINAFVNKSITVINTNSDYPKLEIGQVVNNIYSIKEKISSYSGEADLFRVINISNNKELVLKLFRRKDAIKQEILNKLTNIHNINIAEFLDNGQIEGFTYIVIPFYSNNSLGSYVEQGIRFSLDELKGLVIPSIAEGLKVLHDEGIIHKDLKPSNLMVSNDEQHIVLIDFGISSVTNGNTVVVTQTGKSPFYSAPETNTGLFLADSDYYSLGITLYELATGYTPYQNINIENLAGFQQIQKIPFPKEFDPELKDLIEGLTYKDISNRNDKANPNRRWGYEEIQKWLKGEKQQIPGQIGNSNQSTVSTTGAMNANKIPYLFKGQKLFENKAIIEALLQNWEDGKKDLFRGILSRYYDIIEQHELAEVCIKAEELAKENNNEDIVFLKLMYNLCPTISSLYWLNNKFSDIKEYGQLLLSEAFKDTPTNLDLIKSAKIFLANGILQDFVSRSGSADKKGVIKLINLCAKYAKTKPVDDIGEAVRLGSSLIGSNAFKIGKIIFKDIAQFNEYLDELYNSNITEYVLFNKNNSVAIQSIANELNEQQQTEFTKNLLTKEKVIILGNNNDYCFRNAQEIIKFLNDLYDSNKLLELYGFWSTYQVECKKVINRSPKKCKLNFADFTKKIDKLLRIDEHLFKDADDLHNYLDIVEAKYKPAKLDFIQAHRASLYSSSYEHDSETSSFITKLLANVNQEFNWRFFRIFSGIRVLTCICRSAF